MPAPHVSGGWPFDADVRDRLERRFVGSKPLAFRYSPAHQFPQTAALGEFRYQGVRSVDPSLEPTGPTGTPSFSPRGHPA